MMLKKLFFMTTILFLFVLTANSNVLKGFVEQALLMATL